MTPEEKLNEGDCSNCRFSQEVAPYKIFLKCELDGKLKDAGHGCDKWESILVGNLEKLI